MLDSTKLTILRQLFTCLDASQKSDFMAWISAQDSSPRSVSPKAAAFSTEDFLSKTRNLTICPFCGSVHIVRNGHRNGRQRFVCKDCGKTFGVAHGTILFQTKKELAVWNQYIDCMMRKLPLRKTAKICRIRLSTAFVWRHKILDALTNMMDGIKLDGVVECDETYELLSFKGNHRNSKSFTMPRKPRKRGGKARRRGLSSEQVCITCGVNLGHLSVGRVSNLGKPSCSDLGWVLDGHIAAG